MEKVSKINVSAKKSIDDLLKEDEGQLYKVIYDNNPLGMAFSDPFGKVIKVNNNYCQLLGCSEEELLQMKFGQLTSSEEGEREVKGVREALAQGKKNFRIEKSMYRKDGEKIWVDVSMTFVRDKSTEALQYVIAMVRDVTEKVKIAQDLARSQKKLENQNADLEKIIRMRTEEIALKNDKLQRSNYDLESFAFAASHDLKEPLRTIGSFITLFQRRYSDKVDKEGNEYLGFVVDGVQRMTNLINNILGYSRTSQSKLSKEPIIVHQIVSDKLRDLSRIISDKNVNIDVGLLPNKINGVQEQIGIVFFNLISNAIKFNENPTPKVKIYSKEFENNFTFFVEDNGIGIDSEYKNLIFELFKRLHNRSEYEGTGIGLAMCRRIIHQHGGEITVKSEKSKGSIFSFSIPKSN